MAKLAARSALILGASGLVGGELLQQLVRRPEYSRVTALVRRPLATALPAHCRQRVVEFDRLELAGDAFAVDDIFCCLGTTMKKAGSQPAYRRIDLEYPVAAAQLARAAGARQYMLISSMGADPHSRFFYNRVKGEAEAAVAAVGLPAVHVFRPSLLLGQRAEPRSGEQAAAVVMRVVHPLMAGPLKKFRAIEASDVARAMVRAALRGELGNHIYLSDEIAAMAREG